MRNNSTWHFIWTQLIIHIVQNYKKLVSESGECRQESSAFTMGVKEQIGISIEASLYDPYGSQLYTSA